jgi:uncharacterized protein YbdZ (MbtH family)
MMDEDALADAVFHVVMNNEEQYSIWMDGRPIPAGWHPVGKSGPKAECLEYINEVWTDMRPLSLRRKMEAQQRRSEEPRAEEEEPRAEEYDPGSSLASRLSNDEHEVEVWLGSEPSFDAFLGSIARKYVHVRFPNTRGGTTLGFTLDGGRSVLPADLLEQRNGAVKLVGELTLDYVKCRCVADVELGTLKGTGHLEILPDASGPAE